MMNNIEVRFSNAAHTANERCVTHSRIRKNSKLYGKVADRFNQRRAIGSIQALLEAFDELRCTGSIRIDVAGDTCNITAKLASLNRGDQELAQQAMKELELMANAFHLSWPLATLSFLFTMETEYV